MQHSDQTVGGSDFLAGPILHADSGSTLPGLLEDGSEVLPVQALDCLSAEVAEELEPLAADSSDSSDDDDDDDGRGTGVRCQLGGGD